MKRWILKFLIFCIFLLPTNLQSRGVFPESTHPYTNNLDQIQSFTSPGAIALEVTFSQETSLDAGDFILLLNSKKVLIGEYRDKMLSGQTIFIEGDTFYIRLVTDDTKVDYGYSISHIRSIFTEDKKKRNILVDYSKADQLFGEDLKEELHNLVKGHTCLGYTPARQKMFGEIDNVNGFVRCVYTGRWVETTGIPDGNNMNTEHTWPKSKGAKYDPALSDLNHLFPTDTETNAKRGNYPFGTVSQVIWQKASSVLGRNLEGNIVFTPPKEHRGDVARAMFYFSIRYRLPIPDDEESILRQWNIEDPVDEKEQRRCDDIAKYQKKRNPFVDRPEYVDRIGNF